MCYKYADNVIRNYNQKLPLTNKRLQKILFVAMVKHGRKIRKKISDKLYAWEFGPVLQIYTFLIR